MNTPRRSLGTAPDASVQLATEVRAYLTQRIAAALEWYRDCDACEETLENVRRDLASVLDEVRTKFRMTELPFLLRTQLEGTEIVVTATNRNVS